MQPLDERLQSIYGLQLLDVQGRGHACAIRDDVLIWLQINDNGSDVSQSPSQVGERCSKTCLAGARDCAAPALPQPREGQVACVNERLGVMMLFEEGADLQKIDIS
jgi:hypothetical protein